MRRALLCLVLAVVAAVLVQTQPVALPPVPELNPCDTIAKHYFEDLILFLSGQNVSDPNLGRMWFFSGKGPQDAGDYDDCQDLPYAHFCVIDYIANRTLPLKTGICWPKNCSADDLLEYDDEIAHVLQAYGADLGEIQVTDTYCASKHYEKLGNDWKAILVIVMICFLGFLAVLGGITEYCYIRARKTREARHAANGFGEHEGLVSINDDTAAPVTPREPKPPIILAILMCWSPITNLKKLVQPTSVPHLSSLNALRVFSMLWVLLGHACYWAFWTIGFDNLIHVMTITVKHWTSSLIVNATLSVDSFFYMSGFLVTYLGMKELYKKGRINMFLYYFHRIWRLSPPYLIALIFLWRVLPYLGSGPWWIYVDKYVSRTNCDQYWWTNVLYINNFYPRSYNAQCMGWSWYLANDFQMYAISPIFLYAFYKSKLFGILLIDVCMIASLITSGAITYANDFSAYALDTRNIQQSDTGVSYEDLIYDKFYIRIPVYFVGMLAAFTLLELEKRKIKRLAWWHVLLLNIVAFTFMGISVFGSVSLYANLGQGWTQLQTVLYITFSRLLFGIGLACLMHMFYMGHNYLLRKGFEWPIWAVMARLTFSTYLWHPILMSIYFFNQTSFAHYSATTATGWFFTFVVGGFTTAIFGFLLVERPMMNLEKFLMPSQRH